MHQQTDRGKDVRQDIVRLRRYLHSAIQQTDTGKDVCQDIVRLRRYLHRVIQQNRYG